MAGAGAGAMITGLAMNITVVEGMYDAEVKDYVGDGDEKPSNKVVKVEDEDGKAGAAEENAEDDCEKEAGSKVKL